jgi:hypothetical protein
MLPAFMRVLGIDLARGIDSLKTHVEDLMEEGSTRLRVELRQAGLIIAFAALGALAAAATLGLGLAALFVWLQQTQGPLVALLIVAGVAALVALAMFGLVWWNGRKHSPRRPAAARAVPRSAPEILPALPANASAFDVLTHRLTRRAAAAGDAAIERATDLMREGSRETLIGMLATAIVVGVLIGRKGMR